MTDRWKRLVPPVAGVLFVASVVVALFLASTPDAGSSGAKVLAYYSSHTGRTNAAAVLLGYAGVMAVVFYAGMATFLRRRGSDLLATLTIAGGVVMCVGLGLAGASGAALADKTGKLSADAAQALNQISEDIFFLTLFGGLMIATLAMGIAMLRTKAMPKALGIITVIVGVVAASGAGAWFAFMATGPLTLVIAWFLYSRSDQPSSITMPDVPAQRVVADAPAAVDTASTS